MTDGSDMQATPTSDCLSFERLESLLADDSSDVGAIAHLDACAHCRQRVDELRQNNELMARVLAVELGPSVHRAAGLDLAPSLDTSSIAGYELLEEIHRGGQGAVFKARQKATKRTVAVKIILQGPLATSRQRHRFEREIEIIAALRHPRIVTVYDSGTTTDGRLFFAMEFVEGAALNDFLRQVGNPHNDGPTPSAGPADSSDSGVLNLASTAAPTLNTSPMTPMPSTKPSGCFSKSVTA